MILGESGTCPSPAWKVRLKSPNTDENLPLPQPPATQVTSLSGLSSLDCRGPLCEAPCACFSGQGQQKVTGGASRECHPHRFWGVTQRYRGQSSCVVCSSIKQVLTCHWLFALSQPPGALGCGGSVLGNPSAMSHMGVVSGLPGHCSPVLETVFSADGRSKRRGQNARKDVTGAARERSTSIHNSLTRVVHIYRKYGLAYSQEEEEMGFRALS